MNRLKNLWSELSGIEKAAEILAFICLVVYVYFIFNGKGAKMILYWVSYSFSTVSDV